VSRGKRTELARSELAFADARAGGAGAVLGDFAESRETGSQALRDLFGLVVRRRAGLWLDWRPWVILVAFVVPLGTLLGISAGSLPAKAHSHLDVRE
jgi:hypothetical protein